MEKKETILKNLEKKFKQKALNCNAEAEKDWDNDKIFTVDVCKLIKSKNPSPAMVEYMKKKNEGIDNTGNTCKIDLSIGKFEQSFYTILMDNNGWKVLDKSGYSSYLNDIMDYFIFPIFKEDKK